MVNITIGEYYGSYEGFDEMGLYIPRVGLLKSASSATESTASADSTTATNQAAQAAQAAGVATMRRYSHLKLMISYMLGTGALAGKINYLLIDQYIGKRIRKVDRITELYWFILNFSYPQS